MFFKIGFFVLLALLVMMVWVFMKSNPMKNEGAASWTEYYSSNPQKTMKFLHDSFDITATKMPHSSGTGSDYYSLKAKGQFWPFAGVMGELPKMSNGKKVEPHTVVYLTVKDFDASNKKMLKNGAKTITEPMIVHGMKIGFYEIPGDLVIAIAQYENVKK